MITLIVICLVVGTFYWWLRCKFDYWKHHGFDQLEPTIPVGNFGPFFRQRLSINENYLQLYERSRHLPLVGIYISLRPALLVNDPELVRNVLVRDFEYFHDRGFCLNVDKDPLSEHLFALQGDDWKYHRSRLNPAFGTNRLREMVPNMVKISQVLQEHVGKFAESGAQVDVREIMSRYYIDLIASVGFGVEIDSINNSYHEFRQMSIKVLEPTWKNVLRLGSTIFMPKVKDWLGFKMIAQEVEDFMLNLVNSIAEEREKSGTIRKDIMQLLLQLRNTGSVSTNEDRWDVGMSTSAKMLSFEQITAHALVFFIAGYETSASTITFCLYELCRNPAIQRKVQQEIDAVIDDHCEPITYDHLTRLKYLESCIDETLRKYPVIAFLNRECTKDYRVPGTNKTIPKGTPIVISTLGLQRDPNLYPNPNRFNPGRFSDLKSKIADRSHLSFGAGPHICIGQRLGKLQILLGLIAVLSKFDVQLAEASDGELKFNKRSIITCSEKPICMIVTERRSV